MHKILFRLTICLLLLSTEVSGQISQSPYSRFGLGEPFYPNSVRNLSMGGIAIGSYGIGTINFVNPASYGDLRLTTMDLSGSAGIRSQKSDIGSTSRFEGGFNNIAFGFPTNKGLAFAVGLTPYTATGYNVTVPDSLNVDGTMEPFTEEYFGDGGLNQFYLGIGTKLFKRLSLGANLAYAFGTTTYNSRNDFENNFFAPTHYRRKISMGGFIPRFGLQYNQKISFNRKVDEYKVFQDQVKLLEQENKSLNKEERSLQNEKVRLGKNEANSKSRAATVERDREIVERQLDVAKNSDWSNESEIAKLEKKDQALLRKRKKILLSVQTDIRKNRDALRTVTKRQNMINTRITSTGEKMATLKTDSAKRYTLKEDKIFFRAGLILEPGVNIKGDQLIELGNSAILDNSTILDTLVNETDGKIKLPLTYGFGFSFVKPDVWTLGMDVSMRNWSNFSYFDDPTTLQNSLRINAGGEYIHKKFSTQFYKRIAWRGGVFYNATPFDINGEKINELGFTVGAGLPLGRPEFRSKVYSRINLGVRFSKRGSTSNGLLQENTMLFNLGVTLNDRWFVKKRVD